MAEPEEDSFVFPPIPTSSISSFQDWITTRKISWKRKRNQLAIDPTSAPDSFVFPPIPTSSILSFQDWITTRKRSWRTDYLPKIKDAIEARNIHYFNNHFAFQFPDIPKEEKNTNTVTVIPESNPKAIFKARVNNAVMTLPLAPPEDDRTFCQVGGKLPVTDELYDEFTVTGHGICHIFKEENWDGCIDVGKYYPHDFTPEIAADFAGGICEHGLIPLQSKKKNLGGHAKAYGWMMGLHGAPWGMGHMIKNHGVRDDEKLVCVAILAGDARLSQYTQYYIKDSVYCDAVHPVVASTPGRVYPKDTVEFYPNNIPDFLAKAKAHPSIVPLLTKEEKLERSRAYQRSYNQSDANRCSFSDKHCNKQQQQGCNKMCREHYRQWWNFILTTFEANQCSFSNEHCNKQQQQGCNKMCREHYTIFKVENN